MLGANHGDLWRAAVFEVELLLMSPSRDVGVVHQTAGTVMGAWPGV